MANKAPVRPIKDIWFATIHHSAVSTPAKNLAELKVKASQYDAWHKAKSWAIETGGEHGYKYISYHYLIATNGAVLQTQDVKYVRYHAGDNARGRMSHNLHGIAICFDGYFHTPHNQQPTEAQLQSAAHIIRTFEKTHNQVLTVKGHRDTSLTGTSCAGDNLQAKIPVIIKYANSPPAPPTLPPTDPYKAKYEAVVKERDQLLKEVESVKKSLDDLRAEIAQKIVGYEEQISELKVELERVKNESAEQSSELGIVTKFISWVKSVWIKS